MENSGHKLHSLGRLCVQVAILIALSLAPSIAWAWGREGHQIIAYIAASELTPRAHSQISTLLGSDPEVAMVQASTWADEIRPQRPETAPWHYVDIPIDATGYDATRDCANDDCVVAQIEHDRAVIADKHLTSAIRAEALRFLIHFIGDVHQPLHASNNNDRGGNDVRVILDGERTNVHAIWDTYLVECLGQDPKIIAKQLEREIVPADKRRWRTGTPVDWANEAHLIARNEIYSKLSGVGGITEPIILPATYKASECPVSKVQLQRAGVRLAWALNGMFR